MAKVLTEVGFEVIGGPRLNLDRSAMERTLQEFARQIEVGSVVMFYYAGHGVQIDGSNWLVPIGANPVNSADADLEMVSLDVVLKQLSRATSSLNIIVLDACRNNPFSISDMRDIGGGLATIARVPRGTMISYATQPGMLAADGPPGGNSPYTAALAEAIKMPGIELYPTFNEVGLRVSQQTNDRQQPWVSMSPISGTFRFSMRSASSPVAPVTLKVPTLPNQSARQPPSGVRQPSRAQRPVTTVSRFNRLNTSPRSDATAVRDSVRCLLPSGSQSILSRGACRENLGVVLQ